MSLVNTECYFCEPDDSEEPVVHATFKSGHEGFLCDEHYLKANVHDQLTEIRLVMTGINRIAKRYETAWGISKEDV